MPANYHEVLAAVTETWPQPDYINPKSRGWMPIYAGVLVAISASMILARLYNRLRKLGGTFGWDDALITIAWLLAVGLTVMSILGAAFGMERHIWDVEPSKMMNVALAGWVAQMLTHCSMCVARAGILLFYRRTEKDVISRGWLCTVWIALGVNAAYFVAVLICYCLICRPLGAYWHYYDPFDSTPSVCIDGVGISLGVGIGSIALNLTAAALPFFMLRSYRRHIAARNRRLLNLLFIFSFLSVSCAAVKTFYLFEMTRSNDLTWIMFDLLLACQAETHITIVLACAASFRLYLRYIFKPSARRTWSTISVPGESGTGTHHKPSKASMTTTPTAKLPTMIAKKACTSCGIRRCSHCGIIQFTDGTIRLVARQEEVDKRQHWPLPPTPVQPAGKDKNPVFPVVTTEELSSPAASEFPSITKQYRHSAFKVDFSKTWPGPTKEEREEQRRVEEQKAEERRSEERKSQVKKLEEMKAEHRTVEERKAATRNSEEKRVSDRAVAEELAVERRESERIAAEAVTEEKVLEARQIADQKLAQRRVNHERRESLERRSVAAFDESIIPTSSSSSSKNGL